MSFGPVVARELRVQARRKGTYRIRAVAAGIALLIMLWMLILSSASISVSQVGRSIFSVLSFISFMFCLFVGMRATSDSLSEEKREGTLGLLFLTDLKGRQIVFGKVAASSLLAITGLLGIVPVLSLALLLGGVTLQQVFLVGLVLLNTMFLSLSAGAFVSSISTNERRAMVGCGALLLALFFLPYVTGYFVGSFDRPLFLHKYVWPSPLHAFSMATDPLALIGTPMYIRHSLAATHVIGWVLLLAAAGLLRRSINVAPTVRLAGLKAFTERQVYGNAISRRKHRTRLLNRNAFSWLAAREKAKPRYAWLVLFSFAVLMGMAFWFFPDMLFDFGITVGVLFLAQFVFKIWLTSEVCSRIIEDRQSGAFELLLSTPLSVRDIAKGQSVALRHIFLWPVAALLLGEIAMIYLCLNAPRQAVESKDMIILFVVGMSIFLLDLWALKWVAMWHSLYSKSVGRVLITTLSKVLLLPWALFGVFMTFVAIRSVVVATTQVEDYWFTVAWAGISATVALTLGLAAKSNFLRTFREVAAGRFEAIAKQPGTVSLWVEHLLGKARVVRSIGIYIPTPLRRHWMLTSIAAVILLIIAGMLVRQYYWKAKVEVHLARIQEAGMPTTLLELDKFYPPVPTVENLVERLKLAGPPRTRGYDKEMFEGPEKLTTNELASMDAFLATQAPQLNAFKAITRYSKIYFPPQVGPMMWAPSADFYNYGRIGYFQLVRSAAAKDTNAAFSAIDSFITVLTLLRHDPSSEAQASCPHLLNLFSKGMEQVVYHLDLPDTILAGWQERIGRIDDPNALKRVMAMRQFDAISSLRGDPTALMPLPGGARVILALESGLMNGTGARDKSLARILDQFSAAMKLVDKPAHQRLAAGYELEETLSQQMTRSLRFRFTGSSRYGFGFLQDAAFSSHAEVLKTAIALQRYRVRHGEYPARLNQLVPEFLTDMPMDPFTGKPLLYLRNEAVYSVGHNRIDDRAFRKSPVSEADISFHLK